MAYGILVVRSDEDFQIVGTVDSKEEALEMAHNYEYTASPVGDDCPPEGFEIHRRDDNGRYTRRELLDLNMAHAFHGGAYSRRRDICQICQRHREHSSHTK